MVKNESKNKKKNKEKQIAFCNRSQQTWKHRLSGKTDAPAYLQQDRLSADPFQSALRGGPEPDSLSY